MNETHASLERPTVTVVVPSYNHAQYVGSCIRSIINQTFQPSRLLVIDDGSTDNSQKIIEAELLDCPFPYELITRENRGLSATLNEALGLTTSKYFAYLGSDDLWLPDALAARVALLESRPEAVLAYGHVFLIDSNNRIIDSTKHWATYADGDARPMLLQTIAPMSPSVLYRHSALKQHGWNGTARLEDYELYLRLSTEGEFAFDDEPRAAWRRHEHNASLNQQMMLEEQLKAQQRVLPGLFGMKTDELTKLQSEIKFRRAEDFLRLGDKGAAWRLMVQNSSGATSLSSILRMILRLLIPYSLIQRRQFKKQHTTTEKYGTIQIA